MNSQSEKRSLFAFQTLYVLGAVLFLILFVGYFFYGLQPVSFGASQSVNNNVTHFKVTRGEGLKDIGGRLSREGLVKSISVFKLYSILSGKAQKFQPGIYELSPTMSIPDIIGKLATGGRNEVAVTIPEGFTVKDIDQMLRGAGIIKSSILEYPLEKLSGGYPYLAEARSLEGFLFPDTYRFNLDSTAQEVLTVFLDNFSRRAWGEISGFQNWYDYLTLASFLEKEVPDFNDRTLVAGILLKRLRLGIPLQVDAALGYAKCAGYFKGCGNPKIGRDDLNISSPYNTYKRLGWTPTPISNPGIAAIKAAANPKASQYLYYLSSAKTKETVFSRTLEEHNLNRVKYL